MTLYEHSTTAAVTVWAQIRLEMTGLLLTKSISPALGLALSPQSSHHHPKAG
jgi:hypothetical protein